MNEPGEGVSWVPGSQSQVRPASLLPRAAPSLGGRNKSATLFSKQKSHSLQRKYAFGGAPRRENSQLGDPQVGSLT